jgi:cysteine synthase A
MTSNSLRTDKKRYTMQHPTKFHNRLEYLDRIDVTPFINLERFGTPNCAIYAKLEHLNPSGSIKDVMAFHMVKKAESAGRLRSGMEIIEATTGNTGISFAMIAAMKRYKFTAIMPEFISRQKIDMIKAYGGKVILTPAKQGVAGTVRKLEELTRTRRGAWFPRQFDNPDNTEAHCEGTGKEILRQMEGNKIDAFVAGVGTGGTLMGAACALRKKFPKIKIVAVEPAESAVLIGKKPGDHLIEGIGEGFIPKLVDTSQIDEVIQIKSKDAIAMTRRLIREEGLMVGISSGANVLASMQLAKRIKKGNIVTVLPDRGERYLDLLI